VSALEPLLSPQDIAALTGMGYDSVLREIRSGRLRAARVGKGYRVEVDWYRAWLEGRVVTPARAPVVAPVRSRVPAGAGSVEALRAISREAAA
jgi:excisionase family DNA binding protein